MSGEQHITLYYGGTDSSRFVEPMLWVGIYVAAASVVCVALILIDLFSNLFLAKPLGKPQVKPKLFVLNATVLTLLATATKIPNDINSPMPGYLDQLCKQTGIYFICTAMAHVLPSIGVEDDGSLLSNMAALGILVVTTFVNICFQINTGIITRFTGIDIVSVVCMLLMYVTLVSHSLSVGGLKELLERQYAPKHRGMVDEVGNTRVIVRESLRNYLNKYWVMALTSSPSFVVLFSGASSLSYLLYTLLVYAFIGLALVKPLILHGERTLLKSDYHWTLLVIFSTQILATSASVSRDLFANMMVFAYLRVNLTQLFKLKHVEGNYRWKKLEEWRSYPLPFVTNRTATKWAHCLKLRVLGILIFIQKLINFLTRVFMPFNPSLILMVMYFQSMDWSRDLLERIEDMDESVASQQESDQGRSDGDDDSDLNDFVLNLTGFPIEVRKKGKEDWFVGWTLRLRRPGQLLAVIDNGSNRWRVREIRSWSLELATYACIVRASSDSLARERLAGAIEECFSYAVLIDENIVGATQQQLHAARRVREQLLVGDNWLDLHLPGLLQEVHDDSGDDYNEQLFRRLMDHGSIYMAELEEGGEEDPLRRVAAECMDEIIKYLMQQGTPLSLEKEVADAMKECLSGLSLAIFRECSRGEYGTRSDHVAKAVQVFQETGEILELFEEKDDPAAGHHYV